jgi:hypothetical protein
MIFLNFTGEKSWLYHVTARRMQEKILAAPTMLKNQKTAQNVRIAVICALRTMSAQAAATMQTALWLLQRNLTNDKSP